MGKYDIHSTPKNIFFETKYETPISADHGIPFILEIRWDYIVLDMLIIF